MSSPKAQATGRGQTSSPTRKQGGKCKEGKQHKEVRQEKQAEEQMIQWVEPQYNTVVLTRDITDMETLGGQRRNDIKNNNQNNVSKGARVKSKFMIGLGLLLNWVRTHPVHQTRTTLAARGRSLPPPQSFPSAAKLKCIADESSVS